MGAVRDLAGHRALVKYIFEHHRVYKKSFVWGCYGTDTKQDRAALISAVGWCSGWQAWIRAIGLLALDPRPLQKDY